MLLTNNTLRELAIACPAVLTAGAAETVSNRYRFVSTAEAVNVAGEFGYRPVAVQHGAKQDKMYGRHQVTLMHTEDIEAYKAATSIGGHVIGNRGELKTLILTNSHDAKSSIRIQGGLHRLVCSNGLMIATEYAAVQRVRHVGEINLPGMVGGVLDCFGNILNRRDAMRQRLMTPEEQFLFAQQALILRFGEERAINVWNGASLNVADPSNLLRVRRSDDAGSDLWSTFNRVQENLVKGGFRSVMRRIETGRDESGTIRYQMKYARRVSPLTGVQSLTRVNEDLWSLADSVLDGELVPVR